MRHLGLKRGQDLTENCISLRRNDFAKGASEKKQALKVMAYVFLVLLVGQAEANLVINGSFESGIGWRDNIPPGSTGITGWTVTRANIDLVEWY
jgi:hypothetical protein